MQSFVNVLSLLLLLIVTLFSKMAKQSNLHCSFCGRSRDEVKILIAGQEGHICENCVEHAQEIIMQELQVRDETVPHNINSISANLLR